MIRAADPPGFWAKLCQDDSGAVLQWLPLAAHCLDVALVFRALCDTTGTHRALCQLNGGDPLSETQKDRLAFLAGMHDVGKANLGFQSKPFAPQAQSPGHIGELARGRQCRPPGRRGPGHIRELAPILDDEISREDLRSQFFEALPRGFLQWFSEDKSAFSYLLATFSHHGRPLRFTGETTGTVGIAHQWWQSEGERNPFAAIREVVAWLLRALPHVEDPDGLPLPGDARLQHHFAGLVMLADWIASNECWFPLGLEPVPYENRHARDTDRIPHILQAIGWNSSSTRQALAIRPWNFQDRFGMPPRPLQAAFNALDPGQPDHALVILEAETGAGKTEAALHWFGRLFTAGMVDGLYFALPTRVAAVAAFERIRNYVTQWYPDPQTRPVTVLAVPGYRFSYESSTPDALPGVQEGHQTHHQTPDPPPALPGVQEGQRWQDDHDLVDRERFWAAEQPKRFLAATIVVGTVDQALLSILQTPHAHLRNVCLARHLLVVDEVHASDVYMARLLEHLLDHHLTAGGHALLLSATLGAAARSRYINRSLPSLSDAQSVPYPSVTLRTRDPAPLEQTAAAAKSVTVTLEPWAFTLDRLGDRIRDALRQGAKVLVVLNTVRRAITLLRILEGRPDYEPNWFFRCCGKVAPHHGRFAPADRVVLDAAVTDRFGKSSPPGAVLLIGTQTLEQSLDLDADWLVTDLAPADVLLQRLGRLHRHDRPRPAGYEQARCLVLTPPDDLLDGLDDHGEVVDRYQELGYGSVYEHLGMLELTRGLLAQGLLRIPEDNRRLVEGATHPEALATLNDKDPKWQRHNERIQGGDLNKAVTAHTARIPFDQDFGDFAFADDKHITSRLGLNDRHVTVTFQSPFGQDVAELVIPNHWLSSGAQRQPPQEATVEHRDDDDIFLQCEERRYRYSRYGLERLDSKGGDPCTTC